MTVSEWRERKLAEKNIKCFYYLALIENLPSIMQRGILPKNEVQRLNMSSRSFADEEVQAKRRERQIKLSDPEQTVVGGHDVVPLYFVTRTPTLYARKRWQTELVFVEISVSVVCDERNYCAFSDGNVASDDTKIYPSLLHLHEIPFDVLRARYWNDFPDGIRKRNAEFLIYPRVEIRHFQRLIVQNEKTRRHVDELVGGKIRIAVDVDERMFFSETN